jgi:DtxR family Mn-dependent transcriptional regulator
MKNGERRGLPVGTKQVARVEGQGEHRHSAEPGKVTPAAENYLQSIYALTAERKVLIGARLAEHLHVSPPSITQTIHRLVRDGYVELFDRGDRKEIALTPAGLEIGEAATRKHRLIELWLQTELKLSSTAAHEAAHGLEPGFTDELLDRLYESLGHPKTCPHGNPILGIRDMDHSGFYMDEVEAGDTIAIIRITEEAEADMDLLAYLERNDVPPRSVLKVVAKDKVSGAVTMTTSAGNEIRVERRSAALIYVRRVTEVE